MCECECVCAPHTHNTLCRGGLSALLCVSKVVPGCALQSARCVCCVVFALVCISVRMFVCVCICVSMCVCAYVYHWLCYESGEVKRIWLHSLFLCPATGMRGMLCV